MSTRPILKGVTVVEVASGVAGPMAACRLGDLGAEVVKVETGEGDWVRRCPPFLEDGTGAVFFALNRGKRAISAETHPQIVRRLVERADVLITDLDAGALAAIGLAGVEADVCAWNPRLVVAQISALGRNGPLAGKPGSELGAQAMAGYTRYVGAHGQPAVRLGADVAGASTAIFATQAILAALIARRRSNQGQRIDLSLLNSLVTMKTVHLAAQSDPDAYEGPRVGGAYDPPERGWATKDAPITFAFGGAVGAEGRPGWTQFVEAVGLNHLLDDPRFDKTGRMTTGLGAKARELKGEYEVEFKKRPSSEIVGLVRQFGGFAAAYMSHRDLFEEPQVKASDIVREVPQGEASVKALDFPIKFSTSKTTLRGQAPALGEHTSALAHELGVAIA